MQDSSGEQKSDIKLETMNHGQKKRNPEHDDTSRESATTIASIIGEFGVYQLSVVLLTFIRFIDVAMMTNTGPLIAPTIDLWCQVSNETSALIAKPDNTTLQDYLKNRCTIELTNGRPPVKCDSWIYNTTEHGRTLTDTFDLVCDDNWLKSLFQSTISVGVVVAAVIWGSFSDRHGRNFAVRVCFLLSLLTGLI